MIGFRSSWIGKVADADPAAMKAARRYGDDEIAALFRRVRNGEFGESAKRMIKSTDQIIAAPALEGRKDDADKTRHDLLAPEFLIGTAEILAFGAAKYSERNWEKGMAWSRPFAALMRHMWAWWAGEKADPETGKSHLYHAAANLMFLAAYEKRQTGKDDRPTKTP